MLIVYISGVIHAYFKMDDQTVQVQNSTTTALMSQLITNSDTSFPGTSNVYRIFVGFKAAIQCVRQYQLFCETQDTEVFNSESIYQSSIRRMILPRASVVNRPHEYTTYDDAFKFNKHVVCGTFLITKEALAVKMVEIPFKFSVAEFPELRVFDDYCNAVFGNLDLRFRIERFGNIVW